MLGKGKYKGEHGGVQVESASKKNMMFFSRCFLKLTIIYGEGGTR
jgi:hypothetical protein